MTAHAADDLIDAIERLAAPVCVGLDPVLERLPGRTGASSLDDIDAFCRGVLDAVAGRVPCVKVQAACFERYGHAGVAVLEGVLRDACDRDLQVILDAKRGDIGISSEHYAAAAFGPAPDAATGARWLTVNAYLGADAMRPFLRPGAGVFALVRTSNPGSDGVQARRLADGRTVAELVADVVAALGASVVGRHGYSAVGAVVGATKPRDAAALRARMPQQIFLVPGFGAQGGRVDDVRPCFDASGRGAVVTASRSVIYADPSGGDWRQAVAGAADRLADDVGRALGVR